MEEKIESIKQRASLLDEELKSYFEAFSNQDTYKITEFLKNIGAIKE